jgi:hypothetical protein
MLRSVRKLIYLQSFRFMEAKRTKESQGELIAGGRRLGGAFKPGFNPAAVENR